MKVTATISVIRNKYNKYVHSVIYQPNGGATADTKYIHNNFQEMLEHVETLESTLSMLQHTGEIRQVKTIGRERIYEVLV